MTTFKTIKLSKIESVTIDRGRITIKDGEILYEETIGHFSLNKLCRKDLYDYDSNSDKTQIIKSFSPENLEFFVKIKGTTDYKQELLKYIDILIKDSYVQIFMKYGTNLNDHIKKKFSPEFSVTQLRKQSEHYAMYDDTNCEFENKAIKLQAYEKKVEYGYWERWVERYEEINLKKKWSKQSDWDIRRLRARYLRDKYETNDYIWSNKELANKVDNLINNPIKWEMFDNPTQAREDFQTYVNSFRLEELHKYSQQLARELYF